MSNPRMTKLRGMVGEAGCEISYDQRTGQIPVPFEVTRSTELTEEGVINFVSKQVSFEQCSCPSVSVCSIYSSNRLEKVIRLWLPGYEAMRAEGHLDLHSKLEYSTYVFFFVSLYILLIVNEILLDFCF